MEQKLRLLVQGCCSSFSLARWLVGLLGDKVAAGKRMQRALFLKTADLSPAFLEPS
jgi:hypothetical protein